MDEMKDFADELSSIGDNLRVEEETRKQDD